MAVWLAWVQSPVLPFTCSLALAKGLSYSEPQVFLSVNGHYNSTCLMAWFVRDIIKTEPRI